MPRRMPYTGLPMPRMTTKRLTIVLLMVSFFAISLIIALTSSVPPPPSLSSPSQKTSKASTEPGSNSPTQFAPPKAPPQSPPRQRDDTYANTSWLAHPESLSKLFSSEVTLDNERALLPDSSIRPPVYCYYDPLDTVQTGNDTDSELLLMWRRAWWARGFIPFILGPEEAKGSPLYSKLDTLQLSPELKQDLLRWLAWGTRDGGLLSDQLLFPMGADYEFLPSLRQGEYSTLTRAADLSSGLFWGTKEEVHKAVLSTLESANLGSAKSVLEVLGAAAVSEQQAPPVLAYYNATVMAKKYPKLLRDEYKTEFGSLRNQLINAHLQASWQNHFFRGIEVLEPFPEHSNAMLRDAKDLARVLTSCPPTPLAGSCPPNNPKCGPCGATTPLVIRSPKRFENKTNMFTIGVVPHPWTRLALNNLRDDFNLTWIRETSERDAWLSSVTQTLFAGSVSRYFRLLEFKKMLAGGPYEWRSLWFTAEDPFPGQLDWFFGFAIPTSIIDDGKSESPVPSDHINDKDRPDLAYGPDTPDRDLETELGILERARAIIALPRSTGQSRRRASLEAWNMADTEAWRVARAAHARRTLERKRWEDGSKYTEKQRLISDSGWTPGMNVTGNTRKSDTMKSKSRD